MELETTTANTGLAKVAVLCSTDTFVVKSPPIANLQNGMCHAKMRTTLTILTFLTSFICNTVFGQTTYELNGKLTDCSDSLPLIFGHMFLKQGGSIVQTVPIDERGQFKFKELKPGTFQLETYYFYYSAKRQDISITKDTIVTICISEGNSDSLLKIFNPRQNYTIYYYGLQKYSDEDLNTIGKQYGVKWQNLGCVSDDRFDKYNKTIEKILTYRNGNDWKKKFWNEMEKKHD